MKDNMYDGASPSGKKVGRKVSLTEAPGVWDKNPDPGLSEYGHSKGPNTLPIKFAEPDFGNAKKNVYESMRSGKAPKPTSSRINKTKNRYETNKKTTMGKIG